MSNLPCDRCKGGKTLPDYLDATKTRPCTACEGRGEFHPINLEDLLLRILATKGKNKGSVRASMTSPLRADGVNAARAYYVWRLARFHGGADTTMPIMADMVVRGDPFKVGLDKIAEAVAKRAFGTDMAAALVWGKALGL